jgi:hypothetical protein
MRTDRQTDMMKLTVAFHDFPIASKKYVDRRTIFKWFVEKYDERLEIGIV